MKQNQMTLNTKPYKDIIKEVWIDDRENSRKDYFSLKYKDFNPSIRHLRHGDYIFIGYNGVKVCVEFKTGEDFLSSIDPSTNHLHNQVYGMIQDYDYTFVIVECKDLDKTATKKFYQTGINVPVQMINGAVSDLNTVSTVLFSQSPFQTADLLMRMAGKVIEEKPFLWKFGKKSTNTALNYLNCIHGLKNKAYDIVTTLNLHTKKDLDNLTIDDLCKVNGVGRKTAEYILAELG